MDEIRISECCVEFRFGEVIDPEINTMALRAYRHLQSTLERQTLSILDLLPTYTSLAVHFAPESPLSNNLSPLRDAIESALKTTAPIESKSHIISVDYNGEDMAWVSKQTGLSKNEIIACHANREYRIAMLGFRPYFPYLLGLDERLKLPRRENPRKTVPKGSVAIADMQTGIYSETSPGGWHIIGHTDFVGFESLQPADIIIFRPQGEPHAH